MCARTKFSIEEWREWEKYLIPTKCDIMTMYGFDADMLNNVASKKQISKFLFGKLFADKQGTKELTADEVVIKNLAAEKQKQQMILIISIASGGVVLLGGAIALIVIIKKKRAGKTPTEE